MKKADPLLNNEPTPTSQIIQQNSPVIATVISSNHVITKQFKKSDDGALTKIAAPPIYTAHASQVEIKTAASLALTLDTLTTNQVVMWGVFDRDNVEIVTGKVYDALQHPSNKRPRTNKHTRFNNTSSILMLDFDAPHDPSKQIDIETAKQIISSITPLENIAHVTSYSASSYIYDHDAQVQGVKGFRIYLLVQDGRDIPRAGKVLFDRLWLAGLGYFELSRAGSFLNRSIIDASVWQASRIDYAGGSHCAMPLSQRRPKAAAYEGALIDTHAALLDLSDDEKEQLDALQAQSKAALKPQADKLRATYTRATAIKHLAKRGISEPTKVQIANEVYQVKKSLETGRLSSDFMITLANNDQVSISEILANKEKYHLAETKDPIEPEYNHFHTCGKLYLLQDEPQLYSQAHGGKKYYLNESQHEATEDSLPFFSIDELNKHRIHKSILKLREQLDEEDPTNSFECARIAFSIAMAHVKLIPCHYQYDALVALLATICVDLVGITTQAEILSHVKTILTIKKHNAIRRLKISQSVKSKHHYKQIHTLSEIDISAMTRGVYCIKAPTGTGKTQDVLNPFAQMIKAWGEQIAAIAPARALVSELSKRLNLSHYEIVKRDLREIRKAGFSDAVAEFEDLAVCINSISAECFESFFSNLRYLLVDEITQVLAAFASQTTFVGGKGKCFELFKKIIRDAEIIVLADANINNDTIAFIESCRPNERFYIIEVAPRDESKVVVLHHNQSNLLNQIAEDVLAHDMKAYVTCDTVAQAKACYEYMMMHSINAKLITADTKDKESIDFLSDVDHCSIDYSVVISSPKIKSGISIEHRGIDDDGRFDYVVGFFTGRTVASCDAYQMLNRVRYARRYELCIDQSQFEHSIDAATATNARNSLSIIEQSEARATALTELVSSIDESNDQDASHFASNLYHTLEHYQFKITRAEYRNAASTMGELETIKEDLKQSTIDNLINAEVITDDQASKMKMSDYLDDAQVWQLKSYGKRKHLNLAHDATLTEDLLQINMAMLRRHALITRHTFKQTDTKSSDLCDRGFNHAITNLIDDLSTRLNISAHSLFDAVSAHVALDLILEHRFKLAVVGFIPKSFGTKYYSRGKSANSDLNEILRHWGIETKRIWFTDYLANSLNTPDSKFKHFTLNASPFESQKVYELLNTSFEPMQVLIDTHLWSEIVDQKIHNPATSPYSSKDYSSEMAESLKKCTGVLCGYEVAIDQFELSISPSNDELDQRDKEHKKELRALRKHRPTVTRFKAAFANMAFMFEESRMSA